MNSLTSEQTGIHFFETIIPISSKFAFLPRERKTIFDVTKTSERGHKEYLGLVDEVLERIKMIETHESQSATTRSPGKEA